MIQNPIGSFLRRRDVERMTGLSKSSIYAKMANGDFPKQITIGPRTVVWAESHIEAWMVSKIPTI